MKNNGQRFNVQGILQKAVVNDRLSLYGMWERTLLLNGSTSIESSAGTGTTIYVNIPLKAETA